jgi:hypothetical protein
MSTGDDSGHRPGATGAGPAPAGEDEVNARLVAELDEIERQQAELDRQRQEFNAVVESFLAWHQAPIGRPRPPGDVRITYATARALLALIEEARGGQGDRGRRLDALLVQVARHLPEAELPDYLGGAFVPESEKGEPDEGE